MSLNPQDSKRRVWIRRPNQVPTTVLVSETDIVDDLKALVLMRYPTTIGRTCDPADVTIKYVGVHPNEHNTNKDDLQHPHLHRHHPNSSSKLSSHSHSHSHNNSKGSGSSNASKKHIVSHTVHHTVMKPLHGATSPNSDGAGVKHPPGSNRVSPNFPATPVEPSVSSSSVVTVHSKSPDDSLESSPTPSAGYILQPDELVFNVYNHFFPNGMTMTDAFIIETPVAVPITEFALTSPPVPGSSYPINMKPIAADSLPNFEVRTAVSDGTPQAVSIVSDTPRPIRSASNSTTSSTFSTKSTSNGVLLLPRHFQLQSTNKGDERALTATTGPNGETLLVSPAVSERDAYGNAYSSIQSPASPQPPGAPVGPEAHDSESSIQKAKSLRRATNSGLSLREGVVPQVHVLIVEDNVINQKILETSMRRKRIRCQVAKNGKEAVEKWRQGGFHLVLMDIQLPVMSGTDAAKEIRRLEHINGIGAFSSEEKQAIKTAKVDDSDKLDTHLFKSPVIIVALTASSSSAAKSEALAAGCNDFVTKPVGLKWLEQKTIEWGCMQALIDYEGWKNWLPREDHKDHKAERNNSQGDIHRKHSEKGHRAKLGNALNRKNSNSRSRSKSRQRYGRSGEASPNSPGVNSTPTAHNMATPLASLTSTNSSDVTSSRESSQSASSATAVTDDLSH